jgi:hypothetical protein
MPWSWQSTVGGSYTLSFGTTTFGDNRFSTRLGVDGLVRTVPEPSVLTLLLAGLGAVYGARRSRRTVTR